LSLFGARSIQSISSHSISLRSILNCPLTYFLVFKVVFFLLPFPSISYRDSSSHSCYIPCPSHPSWGNIT
jgi:hypothetical protein